MVLVDTITQWLRERKPALARYRATQTPLLRETVSNDPVSACSRAGDCLGERGLLRTGPPFLGSCFVIRYNLRVWSSRNTTIGGA